MPDNLVERLRSKGHLTQGDGLLALLDTGEEAATLIETQEGLLRETRDRLEASMTAIDDWLNRYACELCDEDRVKEAHQRIADAGGTLSYIAGIQELNRAALAKLEQANAK